MKKTLLLVAFLLNILVVAGQTIGVEYIVPQDGNWGEWKNDRGYSGISFRFRYSRTVGITTNYKEDKFITYLEYQLRSGYAEDVIVHFKARRSAADLRTDIVQKLYPGPNGPLTPESTLPEDIVLYSRGRIEYFEFPLYAEKTNEGCEGCVIQVYGNNRLRSIFIAVEYMKDIVSPHDSQEETNKKARLMLRQDDGQLCLKCLLNDEMLKPRKDAGSERTRVLYYKEQCGVALSASIVSTDRYLQSTQQPYNTNLGKTTATVQAVQQGLGIMSDIVSTWVSKRPAPVLGVNRVTDNDLFNNFTKDVIIEAERAGLKFDHMDMRVEQAFLEELKKGGEILHRNRTLNFSYNNVEVPVKIGIHYYTKSIGMNFDINVDGFNPAVKELVKAKMPFSRFDSFYGKKPKETQMMFIRYTDRLDTAEYDIFKQPFQPARTVQPLAEAEITNAKDFEAACDFVAMALGRLNLKLDSAYSYLQLANFNQSICFHFNGVNALISQSGSGNMSTSVQLNAENDVAAKAIENSDLNKILTSSTANSYKKDKIYYYHADRLKDDEAFINIYRKGYVSANYKGFKFYFEQAALKAEAILAQNDETKEHLRAKGDLYWLGKGAMQDEKKAIDYFTKAADKNDSLSMYNLASIYYRNSPSGTYSKMMEWSKKAVDHGYPDAYAFIGLCYQFASGTTGDLKKAKETYEEGAALSSALCMFKLANLYKSGGKGVKADNDKALDWAQKACATGKKKSYCDYYTELLNKKP